MEAGVEWIWNANLHLVEALLDQDYILDMDPPVKPLYSHQEGAAFGYNPQKPGRPSHCYHAFCIAKLRLVLGVVVHAGNETAATFARAAGVGLPEREARTRRAARGRERTSSTR